MLYPLKFEPVYKENMWGGDQLNKVYGRKTPSNHTGESWDVACHPHGMSVVVNGPMAGMTLEELFENHKEALVGHEAVTLNKFPLLIKVIDAKKRLSLQVHPTDLYASVHEMNELGKNEMWYILQAEEGAKVTLGLKDGVDKETFKAALNKGTINECINEVPVRAGDVIDIPAGLIHSIEEGIVLVEIEENSDTVYRVFDWNRVGLDGKPRMLHIEKALDVIDFEGCLPKVFLKGNATKQGTATLVHYMDNPYFAVDKIILQDSFVDTTKTEYMVIYFCLSGSISIVSEHSITELKTLESALIPACIGDFKVVGEGEILRCYRPTK